MKDNSTDKTLEKIEKNWTRLMAAAKAVGDDKIINLLNDNAERIKVSPYSTNTEFSGAYPGGLLEMTLKIINYMVNMAKATNQDIDQKSLIKIGILHGIGKIGNEDHDLFVENDSSWHRERGMVYKWNPEIDPLSFSIRTLRWINIYNIQLTEREYVTIHGASKSPDQISSGEFHNSWPETVLLQAAIRLLPNG